MSDDWNTVTVIGNRRGGAQGGMGKERQVNLARRQGASVSTENKYGAGGNTQKGTSLNTAKLDAETEELKHKTMDLSVGKLIAQGRQAKEMSQKDLATKICEKPQVTEEVLFTIILTIKRFCRLSQNTNKARGFLTSKFWPRWRELLVRELLQNLQHCNIYHVSGMKLRGKDKGKPLDAKGGKANKK